MTLASDFDLDETMDHWAYATEVMRLAILKSHGWRTAQGTPDRTARKAAKLDWYSLSPAMQKVLRSHAW